MRNLSSAFKDELNNDNRRYLEWVDITLKDGTVLNLREDSIWNNGIKVEDIWKLESVRHQYPQVTQLRSQLLIG